MGDLAEGCAGREIHREDLADERNVLRMGEDGLTVPADDRKAEGRGTSRPCAGLDALVVIVAHAFCDGLALHLGEDHDDVEHGASDGGRGVKTLGYGGKFDLVLGKRFPDAAEVGDVAGDAVETVADELADLPVLDVAHQRFEGGTVGVLAAVAGVLIDLDVLEAALASAKLDLTLDGKRIRLFDGLPGVNGGYHRECPFRRIRRPFLIGGLAA